MNRKIQESFNPFTLAGEYTELHIYDNQYYIVMWRPKREFRVVTGAFIRGHFDKCRVLSNPFVSKRLAEESMTIHKDEYEDFYNEKY